MWTSFFMARNNKERIGATLGVIIAVVLIFGIGWILNEFLNNPLVITIGEHEIKPGDTRLSELLADGYLLSSRTEVPFSGANGSGDYKPFYSPKLEIDNNTHLMGIVLVKDGEAFAYVNVNSGGHKRKLEDCFIDTIILYESLIMSESCAIDGIPVEEASVERISEKRGEYEERFHLDSKVQTIKWTKGGYELSIERDALLQITEIIARDHRIIVW